MIFRTVGEPGRGRGWLHRVRGPGGRLLRGRQLRPRIWLRRQTRSIKKTISFFSFSVFGSENKKQELLKWSMFVSSFNKG